MFRVRYVVLILFFKWFQYVGWVLIKHVIGFRVFYIGFVNIDFGTLGTFWNLYDFIWCQWFTRIKHWHCIDVMFGLRAFWENWFWNFLKIMFLMTCKVRRVTSNISALRVSILVRFTHGFKNISMFWKKY